MCLLIHAKDASLVPDQHIMSAFRTNSDGFGLWYVEDGEMIVTKDVFDRPAEVLNLWRSRENKGPVSCHFRMATHGTLNKENSHPYPITTKAECGRDIVMGHNGVIYQVGARGTHSGGSYHPSDSNIFATQYLRPLLLKNPALLDDPSFRKLVGDAISGGNKLIITASGMPQDGEHGTVYLINEGSGSWKDKAWYSNMYSIGSYGSYYGDQSGWE